MKKSISILMAAAILFAFAGCSSTEYVDTVVTAAVTDENGKEVTDKDGNVVTEIVTDESGTKASESGKGTAGKSSTSSGKNQNSSDNTSATKKSDASSEKSDNTTAKGTTAKSTTAKTTTKKQTTTKPTTTEKSKKRDITIVVNLPYYNGVETELTLYYKVKGDKKYTELETRKVKLDDIKNKEEFKIKNIKGEVYAYVELKDVKSTQNNITIPAGSSDVKVKISPVTGIEIMDGGWD